MISSNFDSSKFEIFSKFDNVFKTLFIEGVKFARADTAGKTYHAVPAVSQTDRATSRPNNCFSKGNALVISVNNSFLI